MITFVEEFLHITMTYQGKVGYKGFDRTTGNTHHINMYNISDKRNISKRGISSYSQTVTPITIIDGKNPDTITLEGPLCHIDGFQEFLGNIGDRKLNTLYNVFLPCSILTATSTTCPDISGKKWMVDTFKIKRNSSQKRPIIVFELILLRWYD